MRPPVDNLRGGAWLTLACLLLAGMGAVAKLLGQRLPSVEVAFFRSAVAFLFVLPLLLRAGWAVWRTSRLHLHLTRAALGTFALVCGFYAVTHLPLAEATALSFTKPLFQVVLAVLILGEVVRRRRWTALVVGFLGVLLMLQPGGRAGIEPAAIAGLTAAIVAAFVSISLRELAQTERHLTILGYLGLVSSAVTAVPAALVWLWPTPTEWWLILLLGGLGALGQGCLMRAYRHGEASVLAIFDYLRLPFATALGLWLFGEWPAIPAVAGALLIASSTIYIARREATLASTATSRPPTPRGSPGTDDGPEGDRHR